jgi:hypothetical protein
MSDYLLEVVRHRLGSFERSTLERVDARRVSTRAASVRELIRASFGSGLTYADWLDALDAAYVRRRSLDASRRSRARSST